MKKKIADTQIWAGYEQALKTNPFQSDQWHAINDWKASLSHYGVEFQGQNFTIVYGNDYYEAQGRVDKINAQLAYSNDDNLANSCYGWVYMFEYILIGLGIVTVGSIGYLVLEKRINKYHHAA